MAFGREMVRELFAAGDIFCQCSRPLVALIMLWKHSTYYVFTPRMKKQLMWERTINVHGKPGRNVPMDLHMEHINRACKDAMHSLGSNIDEAAVARIGKGIGEMMEVTDKFDTVNSIPQASGRHSRRSIDIDMEKVVAQLQDAEVFSNIPKRKHRSFRQILAGE